MHPLTFKSAVDRWFYGGVIVTAVMLGLMFFVSLQDGSPIAMLVLILTVVVGIGLPVWLLLSTYYVVENDTLIIRSGPLRWDIPLSEIDSVRPSKSLFSSPALSINRLEIRYGKGRRILVSPADQNGFVKALGTDLEEG